MENIIISLTSTSRRLSVLRHTLISLIEQSLKPDQVILCLSKEPYLHDEGVINLPSWLTNLESEGKIIIKWVSNTGPYRKLIPVYLEASSDDLIITCDDDVIYGPNWLSNLIKAATLHPDKIVCGRARKPLINKFGKLQSYSTWPIVGPGEQGVDLLPIGVAGVVYRKNLLDPHIMQNEKFLELAPKQDDLWFNLARVLLCKSVYVASGVNDSIYEINTSYALSDTNNIQLKSNWNNPAKAILERASSKIKGYLGHPTCDNDYAIKKLKKFGEAYNNKPLK